MISVMKVAANAWGMIIRRIMKRNCFMKRVVRRRLKRVYECARKEFRKKGKDYGKVVVS